MSSTLFGDLRPIYGKLYSTYGHAMVYGSGIPPDRGPNPLSKEEWLFHYYPSDNDNKPFDMDFAIKCTKEEWWGRTYGADKMEVVDARILYQDEIRTWFIFYTIPMYKRGEHYVNLLGLCKDDIKGDVKCLVYPTPRKM